MDTIKLGWKAPALSILSIMRMQKTGTPYNILNQAVIVHYIGKVGKRQYIISTVHPMRLIYGNCMI
ncbi:MAG: hypothetical protein WBB93_08740 [Saprospiraceae bacterium]